MQGHGLAPIRTDQNKELICVDPCSSAALIIFSQLRKPWEKLRAAGAVKCEGAITSLFFVPRRRKLPWHAQRRFAHFYALWRAED
jgi:hypothetical protein